MGAEKKARWWKRPYCWLKGHDHTGPIRIVAFEMLRTDGCEVYGEIPCVRCGHAKFIVGYDPGRRVYRANLYHGEPDG